MRLIPVQTAEEFEAMRVIRNECASFMTGSTTQITQQEQAIWAATLDRTLVVPWLFEKEVACGSTVIPMAIGYGLCRKLPRYADVAKGISGTWWVSGGLLAEHRGQGLGKELFGQLAERVTSTGEICWLDVRPDNVPAIKTYKSLGFMPLEGTVRKGNIDVIEMFRDPLYGRRREVP